jgi:MerR family transcriptional regulator, copper efflux regulator
LELQEFFVEGLTPYVGTGRIFGTEVRTMNHLTTGQLAKQAQVNIETIRYYERRGLLPEPPRRESGYRQYAPQDVAYLQFIQRAKRLGFSLSEIAELLALRVDPETTCEDIRTRAAHKIAAVEAKIQALARIKEGLQRLVASCSGQGPTSACPILEALNTREGGGDARISALENEG